jgi:uncharacterized membrane protein
MSKKIIALSLLILILMSNIVYANTGGVEGLTTVRGEVVEIVTHLKPEDLGAVEGSLIQEQQIVKVKVTTGEFKGKEYLVENNLGNNDYYNIRVKEGDRILLVLDTTSEVMNVYISSFARDRYELYLVILFAVLLLLIGRIKGIKSIITLTFTVIVIMKFMIPFIIKGFNPIFVSAISCFIITVATLLIVSGINKKSFAAILGTLSGVFIAASIAYGAGTLARLSGLSSEEAIMLMYLPIDVELNLKGILFAGILIGTLGAVMDVSMSIASSMHEIKEVKPEIRTSELFKSGMNVGRDIMGTMTNTLILAYTGAAIPMIIIFVSYNTSFVEVLNLDIIATEIIRAFTGSIGIVLTIPITAAFASLLEMYLNKNI